MKFTMVIPCDTCPYRKGTTMTLHPGRVRELSLIMLDSQGATFSCHKSVDYNREPDYDENDEPSRRIPGPEEVHCAGALAYALKHDTLPQMARIMERLRAFDGREILAKSGHLVWDNLQQWLRANAAKEKRRRR